MNVYGIQIPIKPLTNFELDHYAKELKIKKLQGELHA